MTLAEQIGHTVQVIDTYQFTWGAYPSVSGRLPLGQFEVGEAGFQRGMQIWILVLRSLQGGTNNPSAHVNIFAPKRLPDQARIHQHVAAGGFFVELRTVKIDG